VPFLSLRSFEPFKRKQIHHQHLPISNCILHGANSFKSLTTKFPIFPLRNLLILNHVSPNSRRILNLGFFFSRMLHGKYHKHLPCFFFVVEIALNLFFLAAFNHLSSFYWIPPISYSKFRFCFFVFKLLLCLPCPICFFRRVVPGGTDFTAASLHLAKY